jgi:two-component system, probable response regulator PhcQ
MKRLLLVDDEPAILMALQRLLRGSLGEDVVIETLNDPLLALEQARHCRYDVVVSDLRMPELDGVAFLTLMAAVQPQAVRVLLTGSEDFATAQAAINDAGVFRYLCKPWNAQALRSHLRAALNEAAAGQPTSKKPVPA